MSSIYYNRFLQFVLAMALFGATPAEPQAGPSSVRLALGIQLTRQIEPGMTDRLAFPLAAGQFVRIVVMQTGSDVIVTLRDPQERVLMASDLPNGAYGAETVAAISESAGEYAVEIRLLESAKAKGSYQVTLQAAHDATPEEPSLAAAYGALAQANLLRQKRTGEARAQATELLNRIRPLFAASGDKSSEAWTVTMLGSMLSESGDIRAALDYAEQATDLFRAAGDLSGEAMGRNTAGGMLDVLGEPDQALKSFRDALTLSRTSGNRGEEAMVLNNIAKVETDLGDQQGALNGFQQALSLAREAGDTRSQGVFTNSIGAVHLRLGDGEDALVMFQQALPLRRAAKDRRGEAETIQAIARAYDASNQPGLALGYMEQALALEIALGDRRKEAEVRREMGLTLANLGRFSEAEASLRNALEGERAVQDRRNAALAMQYLGRVLMLEKQPAAALHEAEQALAEFRAIGDRNSEATTLETMARAESAGGNLKAAREHIEQALHLTEQNRTSTDSEQLRASFFATRQDAYSFYIDLLMRSGNEDALALEANERSRARSLLEMLAASSTDIREGVDAKLLTRERDISNLLNAKGSRLLPLRASSPQAADLTQEIRALEAEYQDVQAAIRKSSPRYAAMTQPTVLTAKQIESELLDKDTLLLEYSLGEERSYLWVVGTDGLHSYSLPSRSKIEEQARRVSQMLAVRSDAALGVAAAELSRMVFGQSAPVLGAKRLVIVPDGALQSIPFAMLPNPGSQEPLVVRHEVVMTPSASALAALRTQLAGRKPAPKMLAVFADPVFDASDPRAGGTASVLAPPPESVRILEHLSADGNTSAGSALRIPRLPYTAQEAERILHVAPDPSDLKAIGFDATRAAAIDGQLSEYRYLHFATHGYLDTERPGLSAVVLSQIDRQNRSEDGFLRVNDIYNARLSADLVVLSACQTGLGKEVRGEGLMGLTRAFLYAGAPRVIVSLWNVNDLATAQLMSSLYEKMLRRGQRPSAALRAAQLELRKQRRWESPYYWAAFVQQGDWK